jgi:hypothetical protein
MPKRKPFSSFVHIPQDLDFKIREGIPTGFYLVEGGGGAWIYYGGMEGHPATLSLLGSHSRCSRG